MQLGRKIAYAFLVFFALADILIWGVAANVISAKGAAQSVRQLAGESQASLADVFSGIKCFFGFGCPEKEVAPAQIPDNNERTVENTEPEPTEKKDAAIEVEPTAAESPKQTFAQTPPASAPAATAAPVVQNIYNTYNPVTEVKETKTVVEKVVQADSGLTAKVEYILRLLDSDRPNFSVGQSFTLPDDIGGRTLSIDSGDFTVDEDGNVDAHDVTVAGTIAILGGSPGAGKVLQSDASGNASWQAVSGVGATDHATLLNLDYAGSAHTGFEPTVAKGNLTTTTTGLAITGGSSAVIGAGATINADTGYGIPTTTQISNWNTAYGWGSHASAGYLTIAAASSTYQPLGSYLTAESDPIFSAWDKDYADLSNKPTLGTIASYNVGTLTDTKYCTYSSAGGFVCDSDGGSGMVYPAAGLAVSTGSGWATSTVDNSANWNTAFGWGNHVGLYDATGTASGLVGTHESTYNHSLISTALQSETDPVVAAINGLVKSNGTTISAAIADTDYLTPGTASSTYQPIGSYLTGESDPIFLAWDKSTGISITESQISDLQSYLLSESDPIFASSTAAGITGTNVSNWNTAFGWGNHADEGYLTSLTGALLATGETTGATSQAQTFTNGIITNATSTFAGNVGIGTASPAEKLTLIGGNLLQTASGNPALEGSLDNGMATGVYVSGKYAYIADYADGLDIIDISNPASPVLVGNYDTAGWPIDIYVSGKYAYVADMESGLQIIDVSNPYGPSLAGSIDTNQADGVYVSGKYAYVADASEGIKIIDVSNPASPSLVGSYDTSGNATNIYVSGQYAYVGDGSSGLQIIDVSNPASPSLVGTYNTSGSAVGVYVSGKYAYVADGSSGLQIIGVSNPASPSYVGSYNTPGNALRVYVSGKYAYVADETPGLQVIDVSNPASPSLAGNLDTVQASRVYVSGKYAYVGDWGAGLKIADISGIETPSLYAGNIQVNGITVTENADIANDLFVRGGGIFGGNSLFQNGIAVNSTSTFAGADVKGSLLLTGATSGYVGFAAPASATSTTYTLPYQDGSNGQALVTNGSGVLSWADASGVSDHGSLTGLTDDDHSIYALLAGRANGQTLIGGTGVGDALKLQGTSGNGTSASSSIEFLVGNNGATNALTILNIGNIGIGTTAPGYKLDVNGTFNVSATSTFAGNLMPSADDTYSLGSSDYRWKDLFLGPDSLKIYNATGADAEYATLGFSSNVATLNVGRDGAGTYRPFAVNQNGSEIFRLTGGNTLVLGAGDGGTPQSFTLRGPAASGTSVPGADIYFDGSVGTDDGGGGKFIFRTASAGSAPASGVAVDNTSQATAYNSSITWSHTVGAGSNRILIVGISAFPAATSVTYGGVSLTQLSGIEGPNGIDASMWYLKEPAVGTANIVATMASYNYVVGGATSYTNVDQSNTWGTVATATGSGDNISVNVSSAEGELVVDAPAVYSASLTAPGAGQTQRWRTGISSIYGGGSSEPGAASVTMSWASVGGAYWATIAAPLKAASSYIPVANTLAARLTIDRDGNVGIGTTSPAYKLDIAGALNASATSTFGGNVGVGTTNPGSALDVKGTLRLTGATAGYVGLVAPASATSTTYTLPYQDGSVGQALVTNGSGVLSWASAGVSDHGALTGLTDDDHSIYALLAGRANGQTLIGGTGVGDALKLQGTSGNGTSASSSIEFLVGNNGATNALTILNDGNIGVGTTNPTEKLSLVGGNFLHTASGNPTLEGSYNTSGDSYGVYVSGKYAYVADGYSGLQIIDVSNPVSPTLAGTYYTGSQSHNVYVSGKYAYVADDTSGLQIIDVSNPASPTLAGTYDTSGYTWGVYVSGKYAYVADEGSGLQIIDVSNPASPTLAGTYDTSGYAFGVYVSGKYAYVADAYSGLQIIDVSNPVSPTLAGTYSASDYFFGVYVSGKYAYIGSDVVGLQIIDVSNPASPTLAGGFNTTGNATRNIYVSGKYAYVADGDSGIEIIDVSNPASPTLAGTYDTSFASGVYVSGKYAYVADFDAGLKIIDINGMETPSLYAGNINANDIFVNENIDIANDLLVRGGGIFGRSALFQNGFASSATSTFAGNVGIGTTAPGVLFDLEKSGGATALTDIFEITNSGNAASMTNTRTGIIFNQWYYDAATPAVADAGRLTIGTEGNWTSTASSQDAYMAFSAALDGTVTERMRITSNGRVGIGTTSPSSTSMLEVRSNSTSRPYAGYFVSKDGYPSFQFGNDGAAESGQAGVATGKVYYGSYSNSDISIETNNGSSLLMTLKSGGNVGIGTTNPGAKLEVNGGIRLDGATSGYVGFAAPASATSTTYTLPYQDGSNGQALVTNGSGVLSWASAGVSDHGALTGLTDDDHSIYALLAGRSGGQTLIGGTGVGDTLKLQGTSGNGTSASSSIEFLVGNNGATNALTILNNGNVGIGTTAPGYKLEVNGTFAAATSTFAGSLIPSVDNTYSLGSSDYRWKDLFLGPDSLKIYNATGADAEYATLGFSSNVATLNVARDGSGTYRPFAVNQNGSEIFRLTGGNTLVLGAGDGGTPQSFTLRGPAASGTSVPGADIYFDGSVGTDDGGGGKFIFRTASAGSAPASGVAVDNTSTSKTTIPATSLSWSHTVGSSSNRILVVGVSSSQSVSSVTYGGNSLTRLTGANNSVYTDIWYLKAPSIGAATIQVNFSSAAGAVGGAASYINVDQTNTWGTAATATGTSFTPSVNISSAAGEIVVDSVAAINCVSLSVGADQTQRWNDAVSMMYYGGGSTEPGAGTVTMSWSLGMMSNWATAAAPLKPAASYEPVANTLAARLMIDRDGSVGIGTTAPNYILDVTSGTNDSVARFGSSDDLSQLLISDDDTTGYFGAKDSKVFWGLNSGLSSSNLVVSSSGLGIGTTAPSSLLDLQKAGTATQLTDIFEITNSGNASSMTDTRTGILFNQYYYSASTPAVADAGRIHVGTEGSWTSTASTQDSYMAFSTALNGTVSEVMRIDSNGWVAIDYGGDVPYYPLDVNGWVGAEGYSLYGGSDAGGDMALFADNGWTTIESITSGQGITFKNFADDAYLMTILDGGNVGIGTTAPSTKLEIDGAMHGTYPDLIGQASIFSTDAQAQDVGGVLSFGGKYSDAGATTQFASIYGRKENGVSGEYGTYLGFLTRANATTGSEKMRITGAGYVGIGTTSPSSRLTVSEPNLISGPSLTWNSASGAILRNEAAELAFGLASSAPYAYYMQARYSDSTARDLLINPLGGNVGIGTTAPGYKLDVTSSDGVVARYYSSQNYSAIGLTNAASATGTALVASGEDFVLQVNASEKLRVASGGNVTVVNLAGTGNRAVYSDSNGVLTNSSSDARLKTNIETLSDGMDVIGNLSKLRGIYYDWDTDLEAAKNLGEQREIGMVAQEVQAVMPELVGVNSSGYLSLDYPKFTAYLLEVAKAQQKEIDDLKLVLSPTGTISNASSTSEFAQQGSLFAWLVDSLNSLGIAFKDGVASLSQVIAQKFSGDEAEIKNIKTENIETGRVCVTGGDGETVCVDKDQLKNLLLNVGGSVTTFKGGVSMPEPDVPVSEESGTTTVPDVPIEPDPDIPVDSEITPAAVDNATTTGAE